MANEFKVKYGLIVPNKTWVKSEANNPTSSVNMLKVNTSNEIDLGA